MIAVIGCGKWGKNLIRVFDRLGVLSMVCDSDASRLVDLPGRLTTNLDEALEDSWVKAVVIATPATTHFQVAMKALQAGKDVFVEKPMAMSVREGREMLTLAEAQKRILMVGHVLEYHPAVQALKRLAMQGKLGSLRYLYSNRLNTGRARTEENVLWSFAPHDISVILSLVGQRPTTVRAEHAAYLKPGVADVTVTHMEFSDDFKKQSIKAHIFVSWLHPYKKQELVVIGEKGMAVFDDVKAIDKLRVYRHVIENGQPVVSDLEYVPYADTEPLEVECRDFIECIQTRRRPLVDGWNGIKVLEVLERCRQ